MESAPPLPPPPPRPYGRYVHVVRHTVVTHTTMMTYSGYHSFVWLTELYNGHDYVEPVERYYDFLP